MKIGPALIACMSLSALLGGCASVDVNELALQPSVTASPKGTYCTPAKPFQAADVASEMSQALGAFDTTVSD
ncbi:hypothetical protein, partial [Phenylobacterium sp.]|uniref:hypothetical protein n=1 Tax=Phenylobacterium sp. TaxID=1871053 RepID=UPI002600F9FD